MTTPAAFRARTAELLRAAAATDEGKAVTAAVAWARRQLGAEAAARAPAGDQSP